MGQRDKRVDAYIARAPEYAKPILEHVREWFHAGAPDCEEVLKWGHPSFVQSGILGGMAAFKEYCAVSFWKAALIIPKEDIARDAAGIMGKVRSVKDLPAKKKFVGYVKKAVELNEAGVKAPRPPVKKKAPLAIPDYFMAAIRKNKKALATYEGFSPSARREYVEWITGAKTDDTRDRRVAQAVEWMAEGKQRNWKYMR